MKQAMPLQKMMRTDRLGERLNMTTDTVRIRNVVGSAGTTRHSSQELKI